MSNRIRKLAIAAAGCMLAAAGAADTARWPGASGGEPRVGVQVKIQSLTRDDARNIRDTGFAFVRFGAWAERLDQAAYRAQLDEAFAAARSAGLPVLLTVRALGPLVPAHDAKTKTDALAFAGRRMADAIAALAARHRHDLIAVELWNEPDLARYWPTGDVARTFPPFAVALCRALADAAPGVPVVGFGFARAPLPGSVPDRLLAGVHAAAPGCLDAVSYHAYGMTPAQIRAAARDIDTRYGLPAIVTEVGAASKGGDGEQRQAHRLRALLDARGELHTPLISVYEWADTASAGDAAQRAYGVVHADRSPKPALDALRAALRTAPLPR
ncbi:beta-xylosidase [Burkholderia contaminans]|uniref:beta-xylosidase n=1 Tax=Burkholderia contaminans TaxID=488447 RepID=UPI001CF2607C|nr:beta-xylosidase [Burkholderia contaminans]MCA7916134.1 beta-xylosidase [Burkholderia contaminans]UUX40474.1 beta-xylosidase [Burkholderia contaminans]